MAQLAKVKAVRFDVRQFQWLGSTGPDGTLFAIRSSLPYKSFKELQNAKEEIVVGTTGPGSNSHDVPLLLKEFAGAKFKLLAGFQANGDIRLALERGEADGWSALSTPIRQAAAAGAVRPLVRGRSPVKGFEHLPVDEDLTPPGIGRRSWSSAARRSRSASRSRVRPGVPADRVAMLRDAFAKAVRDPQFLADAEKAQIDIDPLSAEQVTKDFAAMMSQPPEAIEAMAQIHQAGERRLSDVARSLATRQRRAGRAIVMREDIHAHDVDCEAMLAGCLLVAAALPTPAQAQADFYKGKTVTVVVGARAVGSLSVSAQILTRHWGRYIPGNPTVILRQMPGGAHLNATNHVFNVADADGLTILAANPQVAMAQLFKMPAVRFDVRQFIWLGSSGADAALFAIRPSLPYKTFKDLQNAKEELVIGTTGPGSNAHDVPLLLKEFAGAKFRLVVGLCRQHRHQARARAQRSRRLDRAGHHRPDLRASRASCVRWFARAARRSQGLDHLPVDEDLATSDLGRALMVVRGTPLGIGRPFGVAARNAGRSRRRC